MPLQNRVTPFGDIVAVPDRGLFTGNRGIIHDPETRTIRRRWASKSWLVCVCEYRGRRRDVMARRSWTELFFLDEATAFAAGHRPCFTCRRADAIAFREAWAAGNRSGRLSAKAIDEVLHRERLDGRRKRLHPLDRPISEMPDGTMVAGGSACFVVVGGVRRQWSASGYEPSLSEKSVLMLLTPPSTVRALQAGYQPILHRSAAANGCSSLPKSENIETPAPERTAS